MARFWISRLTALFTPPPPIFLLTSLLALFALGISSRQANATIYYVSTTGSNFNTGLSWSSPKSDLQATIHAAVSGDQVWVKYGTYAETNNFTATDGVAVYGHFAGTESSIGARQLTNTAYATILNATSGSTGPIYTIPNTATGTNTLDGFTIENTVSNQSNEGLSDSSPSDLLNVSNCTFNGSSTSNGNGIYALSTATAIKNCVFNNITGYYTDGAAIVAQGAATTISGCTFTSNTTDDGGAVYADGTTTTISGCTFTGNSASLGNGGAVDADNPFGLDGLTMTINKCTFTGNTGGSGGGVHAEGTTTTISGCTFTSNSAGHGGGICCAYGYTTTADCTFGGSSASDANTPDAIYLQSVGDTSTSPPTTAVFKDNLIIGMGTATTDADGIDIDTGTSNNGSYVTVTNNTIVNSNVGINIATHSGAINVANNIFYSDYGSLNDTGSATFTSSHNDNDNNISYYYQGVNPSSSDLLSVNPSFVSAASGNYHLASGSPLINAGNNSYVMTGDTDLDGNPRIIGNAVDIGCYEYKTASSPTWTATAVSAAPSGISHILWTRSDGAAGLWTLNAAGVQTAVGPTYGPYTGWTAKAVATANDGTSRVLWTNTNGMAGVWTFNAADTETTIGTTYGPYSGWSAKSVGVAGDGTSRVLWTNTNGMAGVWSFDAADAETVIGKTYGPYPGWSAQSLATDPSGTSRILWDNANGTAGIWTFNASDVETVVGTVYGPYTGWSAKAVGASGDGTARVLWTNTNGEAGIWSFNAADVKTVIGTTYGPFPGYTATALGVSSDGTSRVLWDNTSRAAGVWSFGANDVESVIGTVYGPF